MNHISDMHRYTLHTYILHLCWISTDTDTVLISTELGGTQFAAGMEGTR